MSATWQTSAVRRVWKNADLFKSEISGRDRGLRFRTPWVASPYDSPGTNKPDRRNPAQFAKLIGYGQTTPASSKTMVTSMDPNASPLHKPYVEKRNPTPLQTPWSFTFFDGPIRLVTPAHQTILSNLGEPHTRDRTRPQSSRMVGFRAWFERISVTTQRFAGRR